MARAAGIKAQRNNLEHGLRLPSAQPGKPRAMQLDCNRYRHYVDRFDIPEEQKDALLQQVWSIMGSFVDRAFGHSPEQQLKLGRTGSQRDDAGKATNTGRPGSLPGPGATSTRPVKPASDDEIPPGEARLVFPGQPKTRLECQDPITPIYNDAAPRVPARKKRR